VLVAWRELGGLNGDLVPVAHLPGTPTSRLQPNDVVVTKRTWGASPHTDLDDRLKALGVTQAVVGRRHIRRREATARRANEQGFNVSLALDAKTDTRPEAHACIRTLLPRLGEMGTSQEIIDLLPTRRD
jgi:nicotinamidase-related amidase